MGKLDFIDEELQQSKEQGLYITIRTIESPQGAWIVVDGKRVLNMCSNNYLGFANDPELREAAKKAIDEFGVGPAAVRTIAGTMSLHVELERRLAEFKGAEAAILYQSGFNANLGTIPALVPSPDDLIVSDELNHASIIDGVRLSKAKRVIYKHLDVEDLERQLAEHAPNARRVLIITDGVFSMDGDIAPLDKIVEVAEKYEAMVMVDDAHGEGVLGRGGRGIVDHFGLHGKVDVEVGTLSKAFGVVGGYVAGPAKVVEFLKQKARPFLFSSAPTPADVAASLAAVEILNRSEERVKKLWDNTNYFKSEMRKAGFDTGKSVTPITPIMLYDEKVAQEFSRMLFEDANIFAQAITYPTVPKGKARIRVMISATHTKEDLDYAIEKFTEIGKKLGVVS
ncbi:MAG: 8-amino-7-oxononanoate synthase [Candidatus Hydrothermota bacterium]|nr:MAG: 8-amino-7-oxononanoate synthase [Candidatus Hydrothermae bacterium]